MDPREPTICMIPPNGERVATSDFFDCPSQIIVTKQGVSFVGRVLRTDDGLTDSAMAWIIQQATLMSENDNEDRAMAILDFIEAHYFATSDAGKFWVLPPTIDAIRDTNQPMHGFQATGCPGPHPLQDERHEVSFLQSGLRFLNSGTIQV